MTNTNLAIRQRESPDANGTLLKVTPEGAGWRYVSFKLWRLKPGQTVESSRGTWENIGERQSVFEGKPYVVYLPPNTEYKLTGITEAEVAAGGARAEQGAEARLIRPEEIGEEVRGQGNAQRYIRHVLEADQPAERLFLVEVITPSGNWSSYPPHKHDTDNAPTETYLEETYYHRLNPAQGFGFQRVYTHDGLDEAILVEDGTLVMVPRGYHPVVTAPGYDMYYLNVMGGPVREWGFHDDPDHEWVAEGWQRYGVESRK